MSAQRREWNKKYYLCSREQKDGIYGANIGVENLMHIHMKISFFLKGIQHFGLIIERTHYKWGQNRMEILFTSHVKFFLEDKNNVKILPKIQM